MLGFDSEYPTGHSIDKIRHLGLKIAKNKVLKFHRKSVLLNIVNLFTIFCQDCIFKDINKDN